ncbi:MAG: hypothetical protein WBF17_21100, partial [Phycisphaerae bacterium]
IMYGAAAAAAAPPRNRRRVTRILFVAMAAPLISLLALYTSPGMLNSPADRRFLSGRGTEENTGWLKGFQEVVAASRIPARGRHPWRETSAVR